EGAGGRGGEALQVEAPRPQTEGEKPARELVGNDAMLGVDPRHRDEKERERRCPQGSRREPPAPHRERERGTAQRFDQRIAPRDGSAASAAARAQDEKRNDGHVLPGRKRPPAARTL